MTPNEYRRKHRCQTCIYWKTTISYDGGLKVTISYDDDEYKFCKVKRKGTKYNSGKFCKCYKAKELK